MHARSRLFQLPPAITIVASLTALLELSNRRARAVVADPVTRSRSPLRPRRSPV
ncbi:MAG: hypothetical protein AB7F99_11395 [Vicinamibacterales bacterium]